MASTYENDLRLEEMATGENSGSWGTKTNTNLELIADAFSYGTETIADADTTITIADGAADAARSLALKINSSEDLTTTRVVTLAPNTTSKVWIIENNTSGGQTLTISAGSGSNITLGQWQTKIIATDGIGAGSNVVELTQDIAIADLFIDDDLSLQSDGAVINFGADADINLTHAADTSLTLGGAGTTTGLVVNNTATDGDPFLSFALSGTQTFTMGIDDGDSDKFKIGTSAIGTNTRLTIDSTGDVEINQGNFTVTSIGTGAAAGPYFNLSRNSSSPADDDAIGIIQFNGKNDQDESLAYVQIQTNILDATDATEDGYFRVNVRANGSLEDSLTISNNNIIFNDSSLDRDFRVESDSNTHMLFVDAGNNTVGIGNSSPTEAGLVVDSIGTDANTSARLALKSTETSVDTYLRFGRFGTGADASFTIANNYYRTASGYVADDTSYGPTSIYFGDGEMSFGTVSGAATPLQRMLIKGAEIVLNEQSFNQDFRVESDSNANMLFVNAGDDKIGLGTGSTQGVVTIEHDLDNSSDWWTNTKNVLFVSNTNASGQTVIKLNNQTNTRASLVFNTSGTGRFQLFDRTSAQERLGSSTSETVINEDSANIDFRIEGSGDANLFFADASQDRIYMGIAANVENAKLGVSGAKTISAGIPQNGLGVTDTTAMAQSVGGGITLNGKYKTDGTYTSFAGIEAEKENGTDNHYGGKLILKARKNGSANITRLELGQAEAVFNQDSEDTDFRVESDGNNQALWVDAANDVVKIGGSGELNPSMVLQLLGAMGLMQSFTVNSTESRIAEGTGGLFLCRDDSYGGVALVLYEFSSTPTIIAQTASNFITSGTPTGTQVKFTAGSSPAPFGMKAIMASGQSTTLIGGAIICDPS